LVQVEEVEVEQLVVVLVEQVVHLAVEEADLVELVEQVE
jgi:hypothetical protein